MDEEFGVITGNVLSLAAASLGRHVGRVGRASRSRDAGRRIRVIRLSGSLATLFVCGFVACLAACTGAIGDVPAAFDVPTDITGKTLGPSDVPVSGARRLSRTEIDHTLASLLGTSERHATTLLPEDDQERTGMFLHWPFDNSYPNQTADKVLVQAFEALANAAAIDATSDPERRAALVPCVPSGASDESCMRAFVETFGRRAFRRPLASDEVTSFLRLQAFAIEADDFWLGVTAILTAMLQSPDFLYRIEIGSPDPSLAGVRRLDDYEIATRMSYLLVGSTGRLASEAGRREIALRLLDDPRALSQVDRFHAQWLGYTTLPHEEELATAMRTETGELLRRVIFEEDRPYLDVFRSDQTFVSPALAEHYGIEPPSEPAWVESPRDRAGLLGHGSFLSALANGGDTSPTRRGVIVRERLLCEVLPPPPASVNVDDVPETHCKSELVEVHQQGACAGCHARMDPIGWGLENYDLAGRYREHDDGKPECPIDGEGSIAEIGPFHGPEELASRLLESGGLEACAIRQVVRYSMGREERDEDEALIAELLDARRGTDWTFRDLLLDLVASDRFVLVRADEGAAP
jgi:hypothetical protein